MVYEGRLIIPLISKSAKAMLKPNETQSLQLWIRTPENLDYRDQAKLSVLLLFYYHGPTLADEPRIFVHQFELELLPSISLEAHLSRSLIPSAPSSSDLLINLEISVPYPQPDQPFYVYPSLCNFMYIPLSAILCLFAYLLK